MRFLYGLQPRKRNSGVVRRKRGKSEKEENQDETFGKKRYWSLGVGEEKEIKKTELCGKTKKSAGEEAV